MPHEDRDYNELELGEVLREVYRWKWAILVVTVFAGAAAAAYTLTIPNKYESSASLIVRPPESPITGEIPPLTVETLRILAESGEVKRELFERLWSENRLEEWKNSPQDELAQYGAFQRLLSTEVIQEESRGSGGAVSLLPVLTLKARAQNPAEAQTIANTWVELVTARTQRLYTQNLEDLNLFIGQVYDRADLNLKQEEEILSAKTTEADLDLKESEFATFRTKVKELETEIFNLDVEIRTSGVVIQELGERIQDRELDGIWLGDAVEDLYLAGEDISLEIEDANPEVKRILERVARLIEMNEELMALTTSTGLESKRSEAMTLQQGLVAANGELSEKRLLLLQSQQELKDVREILAEQEVDGVWLGELLMQYYRQTLHSMAGTGEETASSEGEIAEKPAITPATERLDATIRTVVQREFDLMQFVEESEAEHKRMQEQILESELRETLVARDRAQRELVLAEKRLAYLVPELERQPENLTLDKAITDDVLWQEFLEGTPNDAIMTPLKTEVLNPIHQRAQELVLSTTAEAESLREEIRFATERSNELRETLDTLRREVSLIEFALQGQENALSMQRNVLLLMTQAYASNKAREEELLLENRQKAEAIAALEQARDELHARYRRLEEEIAKITLRVNARENSIASLRANLEVLEEDYNRERTELETLRLEQIRDQAERELKTAILEDTMEESERMQVDIALAEQELTLLNREITKLEGVRSSLATRAEELALLRVTAENTSRSGTTVLHTAEVNPLKVAPFRGKVVLSAMIAAFLLVSLLCVGAKVVRSTA